MKVDALAGKPKPSNTTPGLIYMLSGYTRWSYTDPFDRTRPALSLHAWHPHAERAPLPPQGEGGAAGLRAPLRQGGDWALP
jgi:hypothetical protein